MPSHPDEHWMQLALSLARRGIGRTSPNPAVGAVLVRRGSEIGRGWHRAAGQPHAEILAMADARRRHHRPGHSTLYVTLEPCSTHGRTPPCTESLIQAGVSRVVVGAVDPNPAHRGRGLQLLRRAGIEVTTGVLRESCTQLNEAFNHWITHRTPWVTVKAAMTLDGRIADARGHSKWITGPAARHYGMTLRRVHDAILVGINTVLADDPALTLRPPQAGRIFRRVILDSYARTPLEARVLQQDPCHPTTVVVSRQAPASRVRALEQRARVLVAPAQGHFLQLPWILKHLGAEGISSLLVEGGGEVNAAFLEKGLAHRIAFFVAPKILTHTEAPRAVAGRGARRWENVLHLQNLAWRRVGSDLFITAIVAPNS